MLPPHPVPGPARLFGRENFVKRDDLMGVEICRFCTLFFSLLSSNFRYPLLGHVKHPSGGRSYWHLAKSLNHECGSEEWRRRQLG